MDYHVLLLFTTGAIILGLASVILIKNNRKTVNIIYGLFVAMVGLWSVSVGFSYLVIDPDHLLFWRYTTYFFGGLIPALFFYFTLIFPKGHQRFWKIILIFLPNIILFYYYYFTNNIISGSYRQGSDLIDLFGPLRIIFDLQFGLFFVWAFINLIKKYKRSSGRLKSQLKYILLGTLVGTALASIVSVIMPLAGHFKLMWTGPLFTLVWVFFIAYAIVRYNWLDIKLVGAKVLVVFLVVLFLVQVFFRSEEIGYYLGIFIFGVAIILGLFLSKAISAEISSRRKIEEINLELEKTSIRLEEANKNLFNANSARAKFLADISHELKTPLTVLQGNMSLALHKFDGKTQKDLKHNITRLNNLSSDLLELARAESGTLRVKKEKITAREIFEDARPEINALAKAKQVNLIWNIQADVRISGDLSKLAKLVLNLTSNAVKYTPAGGKIYITAAARGHNFVIKVKDTGVGIPKKDLPHIFDRFFRSRLVDGEKVEGTGLGLAICKWIVDAHQGEISVKSEEGVGSEFRVILNTN